MEITLKFPALILYVSKVQKGQGYVVRGKTIGAVVVIGESYKYDKGLLAHEMVHVEDFWLHGLLVHMLLYKFSRPYRLRSECHAYYAQWRTEPTDAKKKDFTDRLWLFYNLKYPREYVEKVFNSYFNRFDIPKP